MNEETNQQIWLKGVHCIYVVEYAETKLSSINIPYLNHRGKLDALLGKFYFSKTSQTI